MISPDTRERLLNYGSLTTVMAIPGAGKTSLLKSLGVSFREEPTQDIETLGMRLSIPEYSQVVFDRFLALDSRPGKLWRDSDFFTSVGIFKGLDYLMSARNEYPRLIPSETLIWLNPPMEQTVRNIISRNRRSAMMEIEQTPVRHARAAGTFQLHPAKRKVILTLDGENNYKFSHVSYYE